MPLTITCNVAWPLAATVGAAGVMFNSHVIRIKAATTTTTGDQNQQDECEATHRARACEKESLKGPSSRFSVIAGLDGLKAL